MKPKASEPRILSRTLLQQQLMTFDAHQILLQRGRRPSKPCAGIALTMRQPGDALREILQVVAQTLYQLAAHRLRWAGSTTKRFWGFCRSATRSMRTRLGMRLQTIANNMRVKWWGDEFRRSRRRLPSPPWNRAIRHHAEALIRRAESRLA